jgi:adenylylsulfate kinase
MFIDRFLLKDPTVKRHIAKTITWRIIGTLDTMMLGWLITGSALTGVKIGGVEVITKMALYFFHERFWFKIKFGLPNREMRAKKEKWIRDIDLQRYKISKPNRNNQNKHNSFVIWFTGLPGSGKSTLSNEMEQFLFKKGIKCYALDGDNVRLGINRHLDFSAYGRHENIRQAAEIAKLMVDAGIVVIASFISPFKEDRENAKQIVGEKNFVEVFVNCPLEICEQRDKKGLYTKARKGEIKDFTGISSPYEIPQKPDIIIHSNNASIQESVQHIFNSIEEKLSLVATKEKETA